MATHKLDRSIQQSLLDRLIDLDVNNRFEAPVTRAESLRQFRMSVKRDLEWLLNTTRMPIEIPEPCGELYRSLLFYGLPDLSSMPVQNAGDQKRLLRALEAAIELFEPRLARARVTSTEPFRKAQQAITFHVEAVLMVDPAPERIAFDTVLEISKGAYSVKDT
jgi:type VI secretion system protein ImpF